jgi:hypothetical protein
MFCDKCGFQLAGEVKFCQSCGSRVSSQDKSPPGNDISEVSETAANFPKSDIEEQLRRNRKRGLFWLIAPVATLIAVLVLYPILAFVLFASGSETAGSVVRALLGLIGVLAMIGIAIGIPLGIINLSKRVWLEGMSYDARSGAGHNSVVPPEIDRWNWGAAGLTWIWGAAHRAWISFLVFIPVINIFFWIWLGVKGNEIAWRANKWESVEAFLQEQRKWRGWGIAVFVLGMLLSLLGLVQD